MELSTRSGLWAFAFFCHQALMVSLESLTLKGSDSPVIAKVGIDVVLPCQLSPSTNAKQMEVRWHSSEIPGLAHHYVNGGDSPQKQNPHYRGRTELFQEELPNGNISLLLKKVQVADGGNYVCFVDNRLNYMESSVELKVGAVGTGPTISVHRSQDQTVTLTCSSEGWYPEPEILWTDRHGQRQNSAMSSLKDDQGLHNIQSHLYVKNNKDQILVCQLQSNFWDQTRQSELQLSSDLFPYDKQSYLATIVILCVLLVVLIAGTGFIFKTERKSKGKLHVAKELSKSQTQLGLGSDAASEPDAVQGLGVPQKHLETQPLCTRCGWTGSAQQNPHVEGLNEGDPVQIRLDCNTAHPNLHISSDCLCVNHTDVKHDMEDIPERFDGWASVLGSEILRAGKEYYWEVYVGNKTDWDLGITDGKANRKGWQDLMPENGYWGIRYFNNADCIAFENPPVNLRLGSQPKVIGIHLDGKAQRLDFYDVLEMSHIYTFSLKSSLDVYPFFCPGLNKNGKKQNPLRLCSLFRGYCEQMSSTSIALPPSASLGGTNGKDVTSLSKDDDATSAFLP